jgi:hypothetical protein
MAIKGTIRVGGETAPVPNFNALLAPIQNQMAQNNRMRMTQAMKNLDRQYTEQSAIRREGRQSNYAREAREHADTLAKERSRQAMRDQKAFGDELKTEDLIESIETLQQSNPLLFEGIADALNDPFLGAQPKSASGWTGAGGLASFSDPELMGIRASMQKSVADKGTYIANRNAYLASPQASQGQTDAFGLPPNELRYPQQITDDGLTKTQGPGGLPSNAPATLVPQSIQGLNAVQLHAGQTAAVSEQLKTAVLDAARGLGMDDTDMAALIANQDPASLQQQLHGLKERQRLQSQLASILAESGQELNTAVLNKIPLEELTALVYSAGVTEGAQPMRDFRTRYGDPNAPSIPMVMPNLAQLRQQFQTDPDNFVGASPRRLFNRNWMQDNRAMDAVEGLSQYRSDLLESYAEESGTNEQSRQELIEPAKMWARDQSMAFLSEDTEGQAEFDESINRMTPDEEQALAVRYLVENTGAPAALKFWGSVKGDSGLKIRQEQYKAQYSQYLKMLQGVMSDPKQRASLTPETRQKIQRVLLGQPHTVSNAVRQFSRPPVPSP